MGWIGGVEKLEEFDEFAAAVAVLDEGVDLAGEQIDARQQADRAVALVFELASEVLMSAGLGRQVRSRRRDRLNAGLLVIRDDSHLVAVRLALLLRRRGLLLEHGHLAIDAQDLRHFLFEVGIALLQVIAHLVRPSPPGP